MILPILRLVLIYFLLVAGVVAVFNRDKLAPLFGGGRDQAQAVEPAAETGESAETAAPAAEAGGAQASETAPEATATPGPPATPEATTTAEAPEPVYPTAPETAPAPEADSTAAAPVETARPGNPGAPVTLGTPVATAPEAPAAVAAPDAATAEPAPEAPDATAELAAPVAAPAAEPISGPAGEDTAPVSLAEEIAAARAAYWAGDIEGARTRMVALSEAHPEDADVAGELGNLAFALRDYPAAAEAWHRAGLLLIERGESARVMSFLPFLQSIAPDQAAELAGRLQER